MKIAIIAEPRIGASLLIVAMLAVYCGLPLAVAILFFPNPHFTQLAAQAFVACTFLAIGLNTPLLDRRFLVGAPRFSISEGAFNTLVWMGFASFALVTFSTADAIPIFSALSGADSGELSMQRGEFFKTRTGAEAILIYINTLFTSALLPLSLAILYLKKSTMRHLALAAFLLYSISFLQKALFLSALFPVACILLQESKAVPIKILGIICAAIAILYSVTLLAFGGESEINPAASNISNDDYFSATYLPQSSVQHLIWRSTAVPMFSASDTLTVHSQQFGGSYLFGATSSLFAAVLGVDRVPMERLVAEHQWGWSDIANTNSVYFIEAYINFGWPGIAAFSLALGILFRWLQLSQDKAFQALWPILAFGVFTSGLIGTLLSNGYALVFAMLLFTKFARPQPNNSNH